MSANTRPRRLGHYVLIGLLWTVSVTAAGAVIGAISFPIVGTLTGSESTAAQLALSGARQLGFLAFVWAPGVGIVMAFDRAWRDRRGAGPR